jgi:hypothetical protein
MYRMVDENGNVYFSDQVPPSQVQLKREALNEKVRVLDVVEKAKTPEQIELQKRLDALRKVQEKIIAKQHANDKVLLSNFRTTEDLHKSMENKLQAFDSQGKVIEGNLLRYEQQLMQQQQQAAGYERNGQKVPEKILSEIATTKKLSELVKQELRQHMTERQKIEKEFKADLLRFQFLTQSDSEAKTTSKILADSNAANALGLFICENDVQCEKAWRFAAEFVAKYSTTAKDVESDTLIMHAAPVKDDDLTLSVSKLLNEDQTQIFLDVRCKHSSIGNELCNSNRVKTLREGFAPFIQSLLSAH